MKKQDLLFLSDDAEMDLFSMWGAEEDDELSDSDFDDEY